MVSVKPAPGRHSCEIAPVVRADVPRARAAHAEAANQDSVLIHVIVFPHIIESFESINLAGEGAGITEAAIEVQGHDRIGRLKLAGIENAIPQKIGFAERFGAAVVPEIDAPVVRFIRRESRRHYQTIRLNAAVDLRYVAAHDQAGSACPWRVAARELVGTLVAQTKQFFAAENFLLGEEFVAVERVTHSFLEDLDVRQMWITFECVNTSRQAG